MRRRVVYGTKPGQERRYSVLEEDEENDTEHLVEVAKIGYAKTRSEVKGILEKVAMEKNRLRNNCVTDG